MNQKSKKIQLGKIECMSCKELKIVDRLIDGKCFACCYKQHKQHVECKTSNVNIVQKPFGQQKVPFRTDIYKSPYHYPQPYQRQQQYKIERTHTPRSIGKGNRQLVGQAEPFYYKQLLRTPRQQKILDLKNPLIDKYNHNKKQYEKQIPRKQVLKRVSSNSNVSSPRDKLHSQYSDNFLMNKFNLYPKQKERRSNLLYFFQKSVQKQPLLKEFKRIPEKQYVPYEKTYKVQPMLSFKDKYSYPKEQKNPKSNRQYFRYQVRKQSRSPQRLLSIEEQLRREIRHLRTELEELKTLQKARTLFRYCGMCGRQDKLFQGVCKNCL